MFQPIIQILRTAVILAGILSLFVMISLRPVAAHPGQQIFRPGFPHRNGLPPGTPVSQPTKPGIQQPAVGNGVAAGFNGIPTPASIGFENPTGARPFVHPNYFYNYTWPGAYGGVYGTNFYNGFNGFNGVGFGINNNGVGAFNGFGNGLNPGFNGAGGFNGFGMGGFNGVAPLYGMGGNMGAGVYGNIGAGVYGMGGNLGAGMYGMGGNLGTGFNGPNFDATGFNGLGNKGYGFSGNRGL